MGSGQKVSRSLGDLQQVHARLHFAQARGVDEYVRRYTIACFSDQCSAKKLCLVRDYPVDG